LIAQYEPPLSRLSDSAGVGCALFAVSQFPGPQKIKSRQPTSKPQFSKKFVPIQEFLPFPINLPPTNDFSLKVDEITFQLVFRHNFARPMCEIQ
jgi:hypothetical protein